MSKFDMFVFNPHFPFLVTTSFSLFSLDNLNMFSMVKVHIGEYESLSFGQTQFQRKKVLHHVIPCYFSSSFLI